MKSINVFISSPGDVQHERLIAKRVINKLAKEFSSAAEIKPILWEDMPLPPTMDFQAGIDTVIHSVHIDIAVFILWSRLGSSLGDSYTKKDGTPYASGTEYEYDLMVGANKQTGEPDILAYVKTASTKKLIESIAESELDEFLAQKKAADHFIKERFYDKETKTVFGAYFKFDKPTSFENLLTTHLRKLINKRVGEDTGKAAWDGTPYVGLRSFTYAENEIFCGRSRVVNNIIDRLIQALPKGAPTLFILGKSGCGKSSLVRAGLFPDICDYGLIPDSVWKRYDIHPGEYNESFYEGLCEIIFELFPGLGQDPCGEDLRKGLPDGYDSRHLVTRMKQLPILPDTGDNVIPLIYVDQFEELFTHPHFSEDERKKALLLLRILSESGRIWLIFSMRNDFYYEFEAYPDLMAVKDASITYDVPPLFSSEYQEIVEEPAKKAGVVWEVNEKGESLSRFIANEISSKYRDLPLIEFALSRLYEKKDGSNRITFEAYREIGHLKGAIVKYADDFYASLSPEEKQYFTQILGRVITGTGQSQQLFTRKAVALEELPTSELRSFARKLIDSHLFTADKDSDNHPTITLAHETLIDQWAVIRDWISREKDFINQNDYYEIAARHWRENRYSDKYLIKEKTALSELEYFLTCWGDKASSTTRKYLQTSIKSIKRRGLILAYLLTPLTLLLVLGAGVYLFFPEEVQSTLGDSHLNRQEMLYVIGIALYVLALHIFWIVSKTRIQDAKSETKSNLVVWSVLLPFSILPCIPSISNGSSFVELFLFGLFPLLNTIMIVRYALKMSEIKQWEQRIFKDSTKVNTVFRYVVSSLVYLIAFGVAFSVLIYYSTMLDDQSRKLDGLKSSIDETYGYLDILEDNMSVSDFIFINTQRSRFYAGLFEEEIFNSPTFSTYDLQYAIAQFNLRHPEKAYEHISGNQIIDEKTFRMFCEISYESGHTDDAIKAMEILFDAVFREEDGSQSYSSFSNLTWLAEIVGRHDLALEAFDSGCIDFTTYRIPLLINYGHACLLSGDVGKAIELYEKARSSSLPDYTPSEIRQTVNREIGNDYAVLRWHGIDSPLFSTVADRFGFKIRDVYTSPADTLVDITPFVGEWICHPDEQSVLHWFVLSPEQVSHHDSYLAGDELPDQSTAALYRFKEVDGRLIYEEYERRTNQLHTSTVELVTPGELKVTVIDNGNPEEARTVRKYIKE